MNVAPRFDDELPRLVERLLRELGEDPEREGLVETPDRVARSLRFLTEGYGLDARDAIGDALFEQDYDEVVVVRDIPFYSLCEHHLLPFWCEVSIGYIPDDKVLGLSKFARIAQQFAHRLQLQERMGREIANEITRITGTMNVAVVLTGEHYCMTARGIRSPGRMTSSVMRGVFRTESATCLEFLRLIE